MSDVYNFALSCQPVWDLSSKCIASISYFEQGVGAQTPENVIISFWGLY